MRDNPHPLWRQERCKLCKAGAPMSAAARYHFDGNIHDPDDNSMRCTAPTETEYIAGLTARIAELVNKCDRMRKALEPFADMHREGSNPNELACERGYFSSTTYLFSRDFENAYRVLNPQRAQPQAAQGEVKPK